MNDGGGASGQKVSLHDTSGALLRCNYITVTSVSGGAEEDSFFSVIPSGLNHIALPPTSQPNASSLPGVSATSGITGAVASCAGGSVIFSLAPYDAVSHILISQTHDQQIGFAVTYGVVLLSNSRMDDYLGKSIGN